MVWSISPSSSLLIDPAKLRPTSDQPPLELPSRCNVLAVSMLPKSTRLWHTSAVMTMHTVQCGKSFSTDMCGHYLDDREISKAQSVTASNVLEVLPQTIQLLPGLRTKLGIAASRMHRKQRCL